MFDYKKAISGKFKNLSILIAEDDQSSRVLIHNLINDICKVLHLVKDGKEVKKSATEKVYDIILLDMHMPKFDGIKVTKYIKNESINKDTPIVALTANISVDDRSNFIKVGVNDFVYEPYTPESIYSVIYRNAEISILDIKHIESITGNNKNRFIELTDTFFQRHTDIETFCNEKNSLGEMDLLREYIHKLKGSAGVLGLFKIYRLALKIQYNVEDRGLWNELFTSMEETKNYIIKKFEVN